MQFRKEMSVFICLLTLFAPATECAKSLTVTLMAANVLLKPRAHLERV